jgi:5-enolpyruvylshikimate-3-phosphate synthase
VPRAARSAARHEARAGQSRPGPLRGTIELPGDKSIAHRAVLWVRSPRAAQRITGLPRGADVRRRLAPWRRSGPRVEEARSATVCTAVGARLRRGGPT